MPSTDRYWRVYLSIGIVLIAIGVASSIALLLDTPVSGVSWISALTHMDWSALLPAGFYGLIGVNAITMANRSRKRERLRAQARTGVVAAMSLAGVKPQGVEPAALEREPVELLRLPERASWLVVGMALFFALIVVGFITLIAVAVVQSATMVESATVETPWGVIAGGAGVGALEVGLGVWLRARRRTAPTGVVATDAGLRWIRGGKERAFVPWDEARLLEFWHSENSNWGSGFALSSDRALVEWRDYPPGEGPAAADGSSSEVIHLRGQALLQAIIVRTGLEPRTCGPMPKWVEKAELVARSNDRSWRNVLIGSAVWLFITAFPLVAAAGALLAPLTDSLAVNLYVAVTMGALGLALLGLFKKGLAELLKGAPTQPIPRPMIRLPDAPQMGATPLTMRVVKVRRDNATLVGVLLLIAGDLYALVRGFIYSVTSMSGPTPWWDPRSLTLTTLGLTSFIVGFIAFAVLLYKTPRGFVDERGVHMERGKKTILIPWDMVAELVITVVRGEVVIYEVIASDTQRTRITWPVEVALDGVTPASGESPGAVFAAAVAQRAGVTPRVEYK